MSDELKQKQEIYEDHPRIISVTHKFRGNITWEEALALVIINRLKRLKLLD